MGILKEKMKTVEWTFDNLFHVPMWLCFGIGIIIMVIVYVLGVGRIAEGKNPFELFKYYGIGGIFFGIGLVLFCVWFVIDGITN